MKRRMTVLALLMGLLAFGQAPKVAAELQQLDPGASVAVIVQFDQDPTDIHHRKVSNLGGVWHRTMHSIHSASYSLPAGAVSDLAFEPSVVHISVDHTLTAKLDYAAAAINAKPVWLSGVLGTGVGVAVIDSGITASKDLQYSGTSRLVYSQSFVSGSNADDEYGHGTHIAGIIANDGGSSACNGCSHTFIGISPRSNLINLRVLNKNGETNDSTLIAAIDTAIALKAQYNIRVINLSIGRPVYESYRFDPLCQAVEAAWKAGIVVVVSAGNDGRGNSTESSGYGTINAPGNDPYVITVGAMKPNGTMDRSDDTIASYSSKGPSLGDNIVKPDLVAPGNRIVSLLASRQATLPKEYPANLISKQYYDPSDLNQLSNEYYVLSGTSMAAGVVSGAAADLISAQPDLTPDQVKIKLMRNAYKVFPQQSVAVDPTTNQTFVSFYDIFTVGAGYLDLAATMADKASVPAGNSLSPAAFYNPVLSSIQLRFPVGSAWSNTAAWLAGNTAAWSQAALHSNGTLAVSSTPSGTSAAWGNSAASGMSAAWGNSAASGMSAAWGNSAASGTSAAWGNTTDTKEKTVREKAAPLTVVGEP